MDKTTKVIVALAALGGVWWLISKDKTPLQRTEEAANQGDVGMDPAALGPHGPDYYARPDSVDGTLDVGPTPSQILDAGGTLEYGPFQPAVGAGTA